MLLRSRSKNFKLFLSRGALRCLEIFAKSGPNRQLATQVMQGGYGEMKEPGQLKLSGMGIKRDYVVAAELLRRGYVATLTLRNTCGMDILDSNLEARRCCAA
jgi:hypothetical protein